MHCKTSTDENAAKLASQYFFFYINCLNKSTNIILKNLRSQENGISASNTLINHYSRQYHQRIKTGTSFLIKKLLIPLEFTSFINTSLN